MVFLDGITMYRLMLYSLITLLIVAVVLSFLKILPFDTISLLFSAVFLIVTTWVNNKIFAKVFKVPTNLESVYITALILTLIITPVGNLRIGAKFYPESSTFKKKLISMQPGDQIIAGQLAGDFVLPQDKLQKLVFIAGGIGITPFRSMIKYLLDIEEKRNIILLYSSKLAHEFVYKGLFDKSYQKIGTNTVYVLTDMRNVPSDWQGRVGYIDDKAIKKEIPDYKERIFYLSGPHLMVDAFAITLKRMGIPGNKIKLDFFPGYA